MKRILLSALLLAAMQGNTLRAQDSRLLTGMGKMLEQHHYLHPEINDAFSEGVWEAYLSNLDTRKTIFLQEDITQLGSYRHSLDEELHGDSIRFYPAATRLFSQRYDEAAAIWRKLLAKPFRFNASDSIHPDMTYAAYPTGKERELRWRYYLQQRVFEKLVSLQEQRRLAKQGDTLLSKSDQQLEVLARATMLRQQERLLTRFHALTADKLFAAYLNVIMHYTDPHSDYFPPVEKQAFDQAMSNRFYGIGVRLAEDAEGNVSVDNIEPGGPAAKNGVLSAGDRIIKVGQGSEGAFSDVEGVALTDIVSLIRGQQGTTVRIGCRKKDGSVVSAALVREEIKQEEAAARSAVITQHNKKTGYIYLPSFYDDYAHADGVHCADDVEKEVKKLMAENIDGLIIDLRNNGGGSLEQVIRMVGLFTGAGPVVQARSGENQWEVLNSNRSTPLYTGTLAVMVNEQSASASEIFAAAIQDYQRGFIIGSSSFGKGTVQRTAQLGGEEDGAIKLTIQKFYRINGGSTQLRGVIPDILLPDSYETLELREAYRPSVLGWDRIAPANYTVMNQPGRDRMIQYTDSMLAHYPAFDTIRLDNQQLEKFHESKGHAMLQQQYRAQLLATNAAFKQMAATVVLPEGQRMEVHSAKQQWSDKIAADIYIQQAVKVL